MKKRKGDDWFPFWIDKWIFGSTRDELSVEQCAVWVDFLAISYKDNGFIRANEGIPYPLSRLAGLLNRPEKLIKETIERCLDPKIKKLKRMPDGTLYVISHDDYELSNRHKRRFKSDDDRKNGHDVQKSGRKEKNREEKNREEKRILVEKIINYFNEKTGQRRTATCEETRDFICGRLNDGRTFEDFKHVIDVKTADWLGDPRMEKYLRPSTLFRPGNFEDYLNEKMPVKKLHLGQRNIDREKQEEELKKKWAGEYEKLKKKYMAEKGIKDEDDIDPFEFPTLLEFARKKEREAR